MAGLEIRRMERIRASEDAVPGEASGTDEARPSNHGGTDRDSPGVLVLAPPLRLLHMTQRAAAIIRQLETLPDQQAPAGIANGPIPSPLRQICAEIFGLLQNRAVAKDWEQLEVKHLIDSLNPPILIRGFGVPDPFGWAHARIVIILEPVAPPRAEVPRSPEEEFRFTPREKAVLAALSKGWTNKEIATSLTISLPTVKGHIKQIMRKTGSATRTEILVKVIKEAG